MKWLKYFVLVLFHPVDTFYLIKKDSTQDGKYIMELKPSNHQTHEKDRKNISKIALIAIMLAAVLMKIIYVYTVNFTVSTTTAAEANAFLEIGIIVIPILLWALASYALMTICGGEATIGEAFAISIYSLVPYIVLTPVTILFSASEQAFFVGIQSAIIAWVVLLLFIGFMQSNGLKFSHAVGFAILSILVMVLIAVVVLLAIGLGSQIYKFIQEFSAEIKYLIR